jgi:hypothetical protein
MVLQEVIIALPTAPAPVAAVRSTLIQSSLHTLRARGYFERYLTHLSPVHRAVIVETLAPEWLSIDAALAHYAACEALNVSQSELHEMGESVGERIQGTFIGTLVRKARTVGLSPWVPLGQFQRLWERLMQGGGVGVLKTGPKDCTVDVRMLPLARYDYFRTAFCGVIASGIKLGAGRAVAVRVAPSVSYEQRCMFKCAWV